MFDSASCFSILAISGIDAPRASMKRARVHDVLGPPHEREGHEIDPLLDSEREVLPVLFREGRRVDGPRRQVDSLVGGDTPPGDDAADDVAVVRVHRFELDVAVREQQLVSGAHALRQVRIGDGRFARVAGDGRAS